MSDKMDLILQQLQEMARGQAETNEQLAKIDDRLNRLDAGQEELRIGQDELRAGQEELKAEVASIKGTVGNIRSEMRSHLDRVEELVSDQRGVLELLSVRSVRHEAEIRDIKRMNPRQ